MAICPAAVAIMLFYGLNDPTTTPSPKCLLHGRIADAWHFNPALFFLVPLAIAYAAHEFCGYRNHRLEAILYHRVTLYTLVAALLLWWFVRNI